MIQQLTRFDVNDKEYAIAAVEGTVMSQSYSRGGVSKSDLVRVAMLAARRDVLEGRARRREKELEAVASAVEEPADTRYHDAGDLL